MQRLIKLIRRYWGKAGRDGNGDSWHCLVLHCLDVAAMAAALMDCRPHWLARVASALRLDTASARSLLLWLVALHDLGKFAGNFQIRVEPLAQRLGFQRQHYGSSRRHDAVGLAMVYTMLGELHAATAKHKLELLRAPDLYLLLSATTGHHGVPCSTSGVAKSECWNTQQENDARTFALALWQFFGCCSIVHNDNAEIEENTFHPASWDIAGLTILADWLGSDTDLFPYAVEVPDANTRALPADVDQLLDYWIDAQRRAGLALDKAVLRGSAGSAFSVSNVVPAQQRLRPAQALAATLELPQGGSLTLIEDQTGSGKTEAMLLMLHRFLAEGVVDGAFIGLPTQATANGLYPRVIKILPHLVVDPRQCSAVLSYAGREYNEAFRRSLLPPGTQELLLAGEQEPASVGCSAWLAESNKRALLAQFGVGTIDQSLLSVLRSRHQALRLLGLDRKLFVVDEVHAYDSYQSQLLRTLLTRIAANGGHAVLLSATLPQALRQSFITAFQQGLDCTQAASVPPLLQSSAYPLLTRLDTRGLAEHPIAAVARRQRYRIRYFRQADEAVDAVVAAAKAGKTVAWVRNTVSDARDAYERLRARLSDDGEAKLLLFHARFALGDRQVIEDTVMQRFGRDSDAAARRGQILIATQVIEQSLDLDFDVLISDLAPIDLLLQRAGRLHRHTRDASGNCIEGPDQRGEAELLVLGPDRNGEPAAGWVNTWSSGSAKVYPNLLQLWRTAQVIGDVIDLGEGPRGLIEAVYAPANDSDPTELRETAWRAEGKRKGDGTIADFNTIDLIKAYESNGVDWPDELNAPTRLGEPTLELVIARVEGDRVVPWCSGLRGCREEDAWAMSVLRIRKSNLAHRACVDSWENHLLAIEKDVPAIRHRTLLLLINSNDTLEGTLKTSDGASVAALYDARHGLKLVPTKKSRRS